MPRKGMRSVCFSSKVPSSSSSSPSHFPSPSRFGLSPSRSSFSTSVMDRALEMAEPIIEKWNPDTSIFARVTSLFYENRREARDFIKTVFHLQKAMHFIVTENCGSDKLIRAQNLMQIAMKRLQKEFYQILSMNRAHLDPESVSNWSSRISTGSSVSYNDDDDGDEIKAASESVSEVEDASMAAMTDLRSIAECMISSGYAKECLKIYKTIRKSIVDEGIYRLGVEKLSSHIRKMDWEVLDLKIKNWLNGVRTAVQILFNGERILSDHVFAGSDSVQESCFAEITREGATILFAFPENMAKHSKKSPDKVFRVLDMYTAISNHWSEIDSIFAFESTATIKSQALTSLAKLGEFVRTALHDFETVIQKDSSKKLVAGAGVHPLTFDAMDYISNLADYSNVLSDILAGSQPPPAKNLLPETYFGFSDFEESPAPAISLKMGWLILVLLCKLDTKAEYYKDTSLSYLFLANNLQYVVAKAQTSNLRYLLGEEWLTKNEEKVKQFASKYERLGWSHVVDYLPSNPTAAETPERVKEIFRKFNSAFDQAYKKQALCVVADRKLRDYIKVSIARKIFRLYREFYNEHARKMDGERYSAAVVRYAPEDVGHRLSDLFFGNVELGSSSSFELSPPPTTSTNHGGMR